eukprot:CAMPEP_0202690158 /NCGR_PEP_ID=MMETSP1385-20130828/5241_1 /ASSEMBLY_ACC=CAM_ASM_000861 /TAXON_ID=933848 /ORGANISM="Elphidium margaritaceum" /LENGTH=746 /DNA_ID=CAMNT_0049345391 /DNA_START=106 /DNA_END=2346 /DNA_ORIENTATION=-
MAEMGSQDGNGRLWERFELANINDRIENIYQHFKNIDLQRSIRVTERLGAGQFGDVASLSDVEQDQYIAKIRNGISDELENFSKDLEAKYNQTCLKLKEENIALKQDLDDTRNRLRDVERENLENDKEREHLERQYKSLRNSIDDMLRDSIAKSEAKNTALSQQLADKESKRKKAAKEHQKERQRLEEKCNALSGEVMELTDRANSAEEDRQRIQDEFDAARLKYDNLQRVHRDELKQDRARFSQQIDNLKAELSAVQHQHDELRRKYSKVDEEFQGLEEKYFLEKQAFKDQLGKLEMDKAMRAKAAQEGADGAGEYAAAYEDENAMVAREELNKLRNELTKAFEEQLKERERQWTKSKNDSISTLDKEYKELKEAMADNLRRLQNNNADLKQQLADKTLAVQRLKEENEKLDALSDKVSALNDSLNDKEKDVMNLKTELSKYKILWQHFFGLDAPLKDEIEKVNEKLDKFENYHQIQSPIPKKKRRVIIESLSQWNKPNQPPLILDAIPSPGDAYQRFELYNINNKVLELKGFKLLNQRGDVIELDTRQIKPGGHIAVALNKRKTRFDMLYDPSANGGHKEFCRFTDGEIIWLCDSFDDKVQLFPITEIIYDDLSAFNELNKPIMVRKIFNEDPDFRGFEFVNAQNQSIKLKNMRFKNKKGTLDVAIPFKTLPKSGVIKLVVTDNGTHPKLRSNDLTVPATALPRQVNDDILLLSDEYGNELELYNMEGYYPTSPSKSKSDCYIM